MDIAGGPDRLGGPQGPINPVGPAVPDSPPESGGASGPGGYTRISERAAYFLQEVLVIRRRGASLVLIAPLFMVRMFSHL